MEEAFLTDQTFPAHARCEPFLAECERILGRSGLVVGTLEMAPYATDWTGEFSAQPLAVARPSNVDEVASLVKACAREGVAVVPQSGRTGLCGGGVPIGGRPSLIVSMERMNRIREVDTGGRTIVLEAGVILETAQTEALQHGLVFPLTFGAKGSAMIGGALSTNAGGLNVVRFGTARELCLGIEAVMPDGSIVNALTGLRKDNTGYDIKDLLIGAEGTLGIITAAVLKLSPAPRVRTTAFLSIASLDRAADVLNQLQDCTGGCVEVFEFMPRPAVDVICRVFPDIRQPLTQPAETGLLIEVASPRKDDAALAEDGSVRLESLVLGRLEAMMEDGIVLDAMIARSDRQREDLWRLRESILEAITGNGPAYHTDICLPLAKIAEFVSEMDATSAQFGFQPLTVGHLGDGNLHYALAAAEGQTWADLPLDQMRARLFDLLSSLKGSFSAEHGIGQSKLTLMRALKEPAQLAVMRAVKSALDPNDIMNPGKMLPES